MENRVGNGLGAMRDRFRTALTEMMEAELRLPHTEHFQTKRNELNNTSGYQDSRGSLCGLRWVGGGQPF